MLLIIFYCDGIFGCYRSRSTPELCVDAELILFLRVHIEAIKRRTWTVILSKTSSANTMSFTNQRDRRLPLQS
jgi:hypothetical protein